MRRLLLTLLLATAARAGTYVVCAGVEAYADPGISPLRYAVADARAMAEALGTVGVPADHIALLTSESPDRAASPTRANLLRALQSAKERAVAGDTILFMFAGHGMQKPEGAYLLPVDVNRALLADTALPVALITAALRGAQADHVLFVLDACRNDPDAGRAAADAVLDESFARSLQPVPIAGQRVPHVATLLACEAGQRAWEMPAEGHGAFTWYLMQGLQGKAADAAGNVTVAGLAAYVQREVPAWAQRAGRQQTPRLENPGGQDFALARIAPTQTITTAAVLRVTSRPQGAKVFLDGADTGQVTDCNLLVELGVQREREVEIGLELAGHQPAVRRVTVTRGLRLPLMLTLEPVEPTAPGGPLPVGPAAADPRDPDAGPAPLPPTKVEGRVEVPLPGRFSDMRIGAGGRYLIFRVGRKLQVFDVAQAALVRELSLPGDEVVWAAGADKLITILTAQGLLQRWNLTTFERERTVPMAGAASVQMAMLGPRSRGPLMLWSGEWTHAMDLDRLEPLALPNPLRGLAQHGWRMRASFNGQTLTGWHSGLSPQPTALLRIDGLTVTVQQLPGEMSHSQRWQLPNGDGSYVFDHGGAMRSGQTHKDVAGDVQHGAILIPCLDDRWFLALRGSALTLCTTCDRRPVHVFTGLTEMKGAGGYVSDNEPRFYYYPTADLLVTIPESNDRVVLRQVKLDDALGGLGVDYLYVDSMPPARLKPGAGLSYQLSIHSKAGGVKVRLESGPEGMKVSPGGLVTWTPGRGQPAGLVPVALSVSDASGQELFHAFEVAVPEPPARPAGQPRSEYEPGPSGNRYRAVAVPGGLTWVQAEAAARRLLWNGRPGHLATITSAAESAFIIAAFPEAVTDCYWLGGYQDRGARDYREPDGGWRWVTGETSTYTNWNQGPIREPNNSDPAGREDYLAFIGAGAWNDQLAETRVPGFVVEWEAGP